MFRLEVKNNIYNYIDTKTNNEIAITLNLDPILDCNLSYSSEYLLNNFSLVEYAIEDIKTKYHNLCYISTDYNELLTEKLEKLNLKVACFDYEIIFNEDYEVCNTLKNANNIKQAHNYILEKLNNISEKNSARINSKWSLYNENIFEIEKDKYELKVLENANNIVGAVEYFTSDKIYIRHIFADNIKYLIEIINNLLKFKFNIMIGVQYVNKELLTVIKKYQNKLNYTYFYWNKEE